MVDQQMIKDEKTTVHQLHQLPLGNRYNISLSTILQYQTELGWTFQGSAYCQLIQGVNKEKRLEWVRKYLAEANSGFDNIVWTNEVFIQYNQRLIEGICIGNWAMSLSSSRRTYVSVVWFFKG